MNGAQMQFYVDMDGVLVDFIGGMAELHNLNRDYVLKNWPVNVWNLEQGMGIKSNWRDRCDADFWANLKKTAEADAIMKMIEGSEVYIAAYPGDANGAMGKLRWLEKHYPQIVRDGRYIFTSQKHLLAKRGRVLIDDNKEYCTDFRRWGGASAMIRRPWNTPRHLLAHNDVLGWFKYELERALCSYPMDQVTGYEMGKFMVPYTAILKTIGLA
jgi:5'(3')-deoxyribonucleotidase